MLGEDLLDADQDALAHGIGAAAADPVRKMCDQQIDARSDEGDRLMIGDRALGEGVKGSVLGDPLNPAIGDLAQGREALGHDIGRLMRRAHDLVEL